MAVEVLARWRRRIWHNGGGGFLGDELGGCCWSCMARPRPGCLRGHPQECQRVPITMPVPVPQGIVPPRGLGLPLPPHLVMGQHWEPVPATLGRVLGDF